MRETITLVIIALFAMALVGCAVQEMGPSAEKAKDARPRAADSALPGAEPPADAQDSVDEFGEDLAAIDALDADLAELDNLDNDLDFDLE